MGLAWRLVGLGPLEHGRKPSGANHGARDSIPTGQSGSGHASALEVNSFYVIGRSTLVPWQRGMRPATDPGSVVAEGQPAMVAVAKGGKGRAARSRLEESQVKSCEHQNDPNIHQQPFPEPGSEEQEIYTDDHGYHRRHVKRDCELSAHSAYLVRHSCTVVASLLPQGEKVQAVLTGYMGHRIDWRHG